MHIYSFLSFHQCSLECSTCTFLVQMYYCLWLCPTVMTVDQDVKHLTHGSVSCGSYSKLPAKGCLFWNKEIKINVCYHHSCHHRPCDWLIVSRWGGGSFKWFKGMSLILSYWKAKISFRTVFWELLLFQCMYSCFVDKQRFALELCLDRLKRSLKTHVMSFFPFLGTKVHRSRKDECESIRKAVVNYRRSPSPSFLVRSHSKAVQAELCSIVYLWMVKVKRMVFVTYNGHNLKYSMLF